MGTFKNQKLLTVVKITLEVLYTLAIFGYLWLEISWILASQGKFNQAEEWKEYTRNEQLATVIISGIGIIATIIGLIGIIKEHKVLVFLLLVYISISFIFDMIIAEWIEAIIEVVLVALTILYIKLIVDKQRGVIVEYPNPS